MCKGRNFFCFIVFCLHISCRLYYLCMTKFCYGNQFINDMSTKKDNKNKKSNTKHNENTQKIKSALNGETGHFIGGLICLMFGVYLFLAFTSFLSAGDADQSAMAVNPVGETEIVKNHTGPAGARLAEFLINGCFGIPAYFIVIVLLIEGTKLMRAYNITVWKWFLACMSIMYWMSVTLGFIFGDVDSFIYPGGLHGYNVSVWIQSYIGMPGLILLLIFCGIIIGVAIRRQTMEVVRKILHPNFRKNSIEEKADDVQNMPETAAATEPAPVIEESEEEVSDDESAEDETAGEKKKSKWYKRLMPGGILGRLFGRKHDKDDVESDDNENEEEGEDAEKEETEPARILTTIFTDKQDRYYKLTVAIPSIEKHDLILAIWYWIMFLYGALLLTILGINIWVFHRSMRPLYVLLEWLDQYTIGKPNRPYVNPTKVTEFKKLNAALKRSVTHNERIYQQQKEFIGNASHEMQTPLAICQNRIEMLMEDESLSQSQLEELAKVHGTLEHISKLNRSLLLISKIENGQYPESSIIHIGSLFKKFLPDYKDVYAYKNITVEYKESEELLMRMNDTLAAILISNLLKNAFVHNINGGSIHIGVYQNGFVISNSACGEALDGEQIFNRFYQGNKQEHSTGLGLAIVATICKLYSCELQYYYKDNTHFFEFSSPKS